MRIKNFIILLFCCCLFGLIALKSSAQVPKLVKNGNYVQLLVANKPFLVFNGDQDHQGRHVRIPGNEYSIQHIKLYAY